MLKKHRIKKEYNSPQCITKNEIRYKFLQSPKSIQIMKKYNIYDDKKSLSANSVFFLNEIEKRNMLFKLLDDINE